ncbi:unnamed protein product [Phaedon cochleariae]|uniref:Uncharacterized protein n=1 Tax=Phaedon cochleariae TaxID=80249 RepID=A0A9N9SJD4_PHACE|nr:unnamed protein product [Phaedon cochleariae]
MGLASPWSNTNHANNLDGEALDGAEGAPPPAPSQLGAVVDDHAMDADQVIWVPFEAFSCQRCLQQTVRNFQMLSLSETKVHLRKEHPKVKVDYACRLCRRVRGKQRAVAAYARKCRGKQA